MISEVAIEGISSRRCELDLLRSAPCGKLAAGRAEDADLPIHRCTRLDRPNAR